MATTSLTKLYTGLGRTEGKCELGSAARVRSLRFSTGPMLPAFFLGLIGLSAASAQSPHPMGGRNPGLLSKACFSFCSCSIDSGNIPSLGGTSPLIMGPGQARPSQHLAAYPNVQTGSTAYSPTAPASGSWLNLGSLPRVACLPQPSSFADSGTNSLACDFLA